MWLLVLDLAKAGDLGRAASAPGAVLCNFKSAKVLMACVSCFSDLLCVRTGALRQRDDTVEQWEQKFFKVTAPSYQVGGCTQVTLCLVRVETASHVICLEQMS